MNNTYGPLKDVRVRQAITYAIDRDGIIKAAYGGYGTRIGSHVPPTDPWYIDLNNVYPYDKTKAKQLLADAGYPNGFDLTLHLPTPSYARRSGEVVAAQLKEVGINVKIIALETAQWLETVFKQGQFQLSIIAHVEPRDIVQYGNKNYYWHYDNPQVAQWLKDADAERDTKKRNDLYAQVQRKITDDAVNDWLFLLPEIAAMKKGIDMSEVSYSG
jgi:peptide/nickel transport system substrate-binding protein